MRRASAVLNVTLACLAGAAALPAVAAAEALVALTDEATPRLMTFDSATPSLATTRTIGGLGASESPRGVDYRPSTGDVELVTATTASAANSVAFTYIVDPRTGYAGFVGQTAGALAGWADVPSGLDFNPVVDRMRAVNANDENFRINPFSGSLAGNDTDLTPTLTTDVVGVAYDRSVAGATLSTVYAIDRNGSELARLGGVDGSPSPNGGVITAVGPLGVTLAGGSDAGFDISPATGIAYAAMTVGVATQLFTVNLQTGAATLVGSISGGSTPLASLTVVPPPPAGQQGATGPTGPTGSTGPAGSQGPAGANAPVAAWIAADRHSGRAKKSLSVGIIMTAAGTAGLEVRKGSKVVARLKSAAVKAGRTTLKIRKLPSTRGRYTLRLVASAGGTSLRDSVPLTIRK